MSATRLYLNILIDQKQVPRKYERPKLKLG